LALLGNSLATYHATESRDKKKSTHWLAIHWDRQIILVYFVPKSRRQDAILDRQVSTSQDLS
jgi:hypothetical protein